jgi:hypothetical protein
MKENMEEYFHVHRSRQTIFQTGHEDAIHNEIKPGKLDKITHMKILLGK